MKTHAEPQQTRSKIVEIQLPVTLPPYGYEKDSKTAMNRQMLPISIEITETGQLLSFQSAGQHELGCLLGMIYSSQSPQERSILTDLLNASYGKCAADQIMALSDFLPHQIYLLANIDVLPISENGISYSYLMPIKQATLAMRTESWKPINAAPDATIKHKLHYGLHCFHNSDDVNIESSISSQQWMEPICIGDIADMIPNGFAAGGFYESAICYMLTMAPYLYRAQLYGQCKRNRDYINELYTNYGSDKFTDKFSYDKIEHCKIPEKIYAGIFNCLRFIIGEQLRLEPIEVNGAPSIYLDIAISILYLCSRMADKYKCPMAASILKYASENAGTNEENAITKWLKSNVL